MDGTQELNLISYTVQQLVLLALCCWLRYEVQRLRIITVITAIMRNGATGRSLADNPTLRDQLSSSSSHSNSAQNTNIQAAVGIQTSIESHPHETNIEIGSLNINPSTQPEYSRQLARVPKALSEIFQTQYFRLYRPLETWYERGLLFTAIVLSLAAGVPLPIIGVIFGYILCFEFQIIGYTHLIL